MTRAELKASGHLPSLLVCKADPGRAGSPMPPDLAHAPGESRSKQTGGCRFHRKAGPEPQCGRIAPHLVQARREELKACGQLPSLPACEADPEPACSRAAPVLEAAGGPEGVGAQMPAAAWRRLGGERDALRLHLRRVCQEKACLLANLARLRKHYALVRPISVEHMHSTRPEVLGRTPARGEAWPAGRRARRAAAAHAPRAP